jgi:FemAB-related protein (PEP-CTERM system-associated)
MTSGATLSLVSATSSAGALTVSNETTADEWNGYVRRNPLGTVDHLWEWRRIFSEVFGHQSEYLVARRDDQVVSVLPLVLFRSRIFGRSVVSLPMLNYGGLLGDDGDAREALIAEAARVGRAFGARYVELRHRSRLTRLPSRDHKVSVRLALTDNAAALWDALDRKVRNQIRKAQKSEFTVEAGGAPLVDRFYQVFAENMRDLGTPVYSRRLFRMVAEQFREGATFHLVSHAGRPVAAGVTLLHGDTILVPWASSLRSYRQLCPNMLLYWTMIEHALSAGARTFDFGRSSADASTLAFKLQWGAVAEPQAWEYVLLTATEVPEHGPVNPHFERAIEAWKRLPLGIANALGPAIVRQIP